MGVTTISPLLAFSIAKPLLALQVTVAGTTIWSGLSYVGKAGVKILKQPGGAVTAGRSTATGAGEITKGVEENAGKVTKK